VNFNSLNLIYQLMHFYIQLVSIKMFKNAPTCFNHHSDHLQGARRFFVKVTEFKSFCKFFKIVEVICGNPAA